jgi:ABC-type transport system involved in cytochrome bd biosynthesis fused ATPase/permease subunit
MGRRKRAAAFSLFSFQDIITSVTAILILVMLLLSIELVSRRRQQAATDPDTTRRQMAATVAKLESLTAGLRDEVTARRAKRPVRSREAAQRELTRVREEFEATHRRHDETLETQVTVLRLRKDAEAVAAARAGDVEKVAQLERQTEADRQQADRLEDANRKEKDRQAKRKRDIADTPRSGTELVYNPQADSNRRAPGRVRKRPASLSFPPGLVPKALSRSRSGSAPASTAIRAPSRRSPLNQYPTGTPKP